MASGCEVLLPPDSPRHWVMKHECKSRYKSRLNHLRILFAWLKWLCRWFSTDWEQNPIKSALIQCCITIKHKTSKRLKERKIQRMNVDSFCKPQMWKLYISKSFFSLKSSILCCDNALLMLWFGLGTKPTWLGFRKHHVLALNTWFCCLKPFWKCLEGFSKVFTAVASNMAGNCPHVSLRNSSFTLRNVSKWVQL